MKKIVATLFVLGAIITSCSVRAPELTITGEKTALENQVLGSFEQIENDAWIIASTRSSDTQAQTQLSSEKQQVLEAVQNRKFNRDDINEFKRDKTVGENLEGFLEILPTEKYNTNTIYKSTVDQVVAEENRDRRVIYDRVLLVNAAAQADVQKSQEIFAKLQVDNSKSGTLIQQADGTWKEK